MEQFYNIHDLVKIRTENLDLSTWLSYFSTSSVKQPDLVLKMGKIDTNPDLYDRLGRFDLNDKEVVERRRFGTIRLKDLLNRTWLEVSKGYARFRPLFPCLLEHILEFKLLTRNHILAHAACISKNDEGYVICAPPGIGKTMVSLRLVKDRGFQFLSDDRTIMSESGRAYCYPKNVKLHMPHANEFKLSKKVKTKLLMGKMLNPYVIPLTKGRRQIAHRVPVTDIIENAEVRKNCKISKLIFLKPARDEGVTEIDLDIALKFLLLSNRWLRVFWADHLFIPYSYSDPDFDLEKVEENERSIMERALKNAPCYEIGFRKYSYVEEFIGN